MFVGVRVKVGEAVTVDVCVAVGVEVTVSVFVIDGVIVAVNVSVAVDSGVFVKVDVEVGVSEAVGDTGNPVGIGSSGDRNVAHAKLDKTRMATKNTK